MQTDKLIRTVDEMFAAIDAVKSGSLGSDEAHAIVRAGAVIVKAHEVDCLMRQTDSKIGAQTAVRAIAA